MREISVAVAQFEARDRDKAYNLGRIRELARRAVEAGAELVSFHECCVPGYTFLMTLKTGNAMILDPFGEVLAESNALGDDGIVGLLTPEKLVQSSGRRYLRARRPELYGKLVEPPPPGQEPVTLPGWRLDQPMA